MKPDPHLHIYAAIGRAVFAYQAFEMVFVLGVEVVGLGHAAKVKSTASLNVNPNRLRVATKSLLKELSAKQDIEPTLQRRIEALIDKRHLLIHRWTAEERWPLKPGQESAEEALEVANAIELESKILMFQVLKFVLRYGTDDPTAAPPVIKARAALSRLFHEMHARNDA